jgi:putative intracellular protease/amidase
LGADFKKDARVVTDGNVTTGAGMGAAYEFGIELLSVLKGKKASDDVASAALIK